MDLYDRCDQVLAFVKDLNAFDFNSFKEKFDYSRSEYHDIVDLLQKDGHIRPIYSGTYAITETGKTFISNGGYEVENKKKKEIEDLQNRQLTGSVILQDLQIKDYKRTRALAWIGALAGLAALIIEGIGLLKK
jgi:hypothetical protein